MCLLPCMYAYLHVVARFKKNQTNSQLSQNTKSTSLHLLRLQREELGAAGARVNYEKLDSDGLVCPGQDVGDRDIIIGKTVLVPQTDKYDQAPQATKRDASTRLRHNENGAVDQVRKAART
jgi:DNA-directed RNA polymerase beta subunit